MDQLNFDDYLTLLQLLDNRRKYLEKIDNAEACKKVDDLMRKLTQGMVNAQV